MRIVLATSEVSPIAKTGGLGDVCGSLPKALVKLGHDVTIFTPYYRQSRQWFERNGAAVHQMMPTVTISWGSWTAEATFLRTTLPGTGIPLILVANESYFGRDQIYAPAVGGIDDFLQRYTFFCRALIRACELSGISPDLLHCHDWHTALLPVYLHSGLRGSEAFRDTRSVYTIHNLNYQGVAGSEAFGLTGLHDRYWAPDALEHFGTLNPMKGGIAFADQVTTVSPNYAREIRTPAHGAGLDGVLRIFDSKLTGILNGVDVEEWDPSTDTLLPARFDARGLGGKLANKKILMEQAGLPFDEARPLMVVVSRLVDQKGFHLLLPAISRIVEAGGQLIVLGSGQPELEEGFARAAERFPRSCTTWLGFDNALAHRLYAAADILLMPSIYEPCGLNQMYALRYGTLPVIRFTGGLADSVVPYDGTNRDRATGFAFGSASAGEFLGAVLAAIHAFADRPLWMAMQQNGMATDFSWERSARQYDAVYARALAARNG